jgi:REP element-mobilizing transposase RayT
MNRGRRGEDIFSDNRDFESFLAVLQEAALMFDVRVAAYCLMSNHYHILLQTPAGNLSRVMRHVNGVYTQRYNRHWGADGQLFRGRFKSILVEEDTYLLQLLRYIHKNPVRAAIVNDIREYPWSSHHGYVSNAKKWDWLHKRFLLRMFSDRPFTAKRMYVEFVADDDSQEILSFFGKKNIASLLGSVDFIQWIKERYYLEKKHDEVPESKILSPTIAEIKKVVCATYGVDEHALLQTRRGHVNEPRVVSMYLGRRLAGLSLAEIGAAFGSRKYSSVGSVILRMEKEMAQDRQLRKTVNTLRTKLEKR